MSRVPVLPEATHFALKVTVVGEVYLYRVVLPCCESLGLIISCIFMLMCYAGWYGDDWWTLELPIVLEENKTNCTLEDMRTVLVHSLSAVQYPLVNESEVSDLGLVSTCTCVCIYYCR